jgi:peptide/nickel transport system substrate-binding protein
MGCRRGFGAADRQDQLSFAPSRTGLAKRRSALWVRCGVFLFVTSIGFGCRPAPAQSSSRATELIIGFPEGNVTAPDLGTGQFTSNLSMEGLTSRPDMDGRALPRLAESWQWENDGFRLRFKLRPGVFFHDGRPMSATIVADILRAAIGRPNIAESYPSLADIRSVHVDGELEIFLELSRRSAFLTEDLNMPLNLCAADDEAADCRRDVGTGPFKVVQRDAGDIVFERFDRYYEGAPAIKRVHVKTFDALRTAWSSLLRGEVDMVTDVPAEAVEFVQSDRVDVIRYKRRYQYMVAFNSRHPEFASPSVRRAFNLAVNREALIQRALRGYGTSATGPIWPRYWAYDTSIPPFAFDARLATTLLNDAGLVEGKAGAKSNVPNARLRFTCLLVEDFSVHERLGLELQKQLYDVGVDMQFEVVSLQDYNDRIRDGQFEAVLVDMVSGPSLGRPYVFWRSAARFQGLNKFGYENDEAERLFEVLRGSPLNEVATRSATSRLQRVFLEDPPALFLAWSERARVVGRRFRPVIEPERDPVLTMWRWTADEPTGAALQ